MFVFGPVPSRRLGHSLGINHIPPKTCPYACIYCQVGRTTEMGLERKSFYAPQEIVAAVRKRVDQVRTEDSPLDYVTFVPDGEPTMDINLGRMIAQLKPLGYRIGVISNASLIWRDDVRQELMLANWVSLKFDAVDEETWRKIDRPHGRLELAQILDGARQFSLAYQGELVTETMLVDGVNDGEQSLRETSVFVNQLAPRCAYLSIPTRPPVEKAVKKPSEAALQRAYQIYSEQIRHVEYLIGYEGNAFAASGDAAQDLLSITAVHPMRQDAVEELLNHSDAKWSLVEALIKSKDLARIEYADQVYYTRRFAR